MLSSKERAFRNVIFVCALILFLILEICFTYAIGKKDGPISPCPDLSCSR